jgi:uncharacterized YkwD family protein
MKKKVVALTLSTVLALSSTSAFAAGTDCTKATDKNDYNCLFKNYVCNLDNEKTNCKFNSNCKSADLNSIDWEALLNKINKPAETEILAPDESKPEVNTPAEEKPAAPTENNNTNLVVSSYEQKVVELVNVERQKAGLPELTLDSEISNVAKIKSKDMADNNYFAHQSPTYGSAGDMLSQFGIKWSAWGENIASGQRTPEDVVTAWMNSSGHRANILSPNFSRIGVGYVTNSNGTSYWTQMFTN